MSLRKSLSTGIAVTAVVMAAATMHGAGTASAAPTPAEAAAAAHYQAVVQNGSVLATIDSGTFSVDDLAGVAALRGADGAVLDTVPTSYLLDGRRYSIAALVSDGGRSLRLTPQLPDARPAQPVAQPIASPLENQLAMNDLINTVSFGLSAGTLIGTIVGAVLGVGAGLAVSGAACVAISIGCVLAVVPIVTLLGGVGGLAGMALGGAPGLVAGLWNYFTTLNALPGESRYASQLPGLNPPAAPAEAAR
ncbi:hypothetical protein ABIA39_007828 [Nocardia sp. GAS34]|uniref:hypothetical protein n=1 Tax=unclassified Nocardia TaxID=2637762 RepID=UPI003D1CAAA1